MLPENWIRIEKSLFIDNYNTLIISDLHFGLRYKNRTYPQMEHDDILSRFRSLINNVKPKRIILNGDIFNNFPPDKESLFVLEEIRNSVDELILIEGNHEEKVGGFPESVIEEYNTEKYYEIGDIFIHHGHHTPIKKAKHHIIGHIHPMNNKSHVFLHCDNAYYDSSVTILPAFSNIVGSEINNMNSNAHCPLLDDGKSIQEYEIFKC